MKTLIGAIFALALISTTASAETTKQLEHYKGGSYCTRQIDHPQPEVFRIGTPRANYVPHPSDCEVQFKGNPKIVRACLIRRCDIFMQGSGR